MPSYVTPQSQGEDDRPHSETLLHEAARTLYQQDSFGERSRKIRDAVQRAYGQGSSSGYDGGVSTSYAWVDDSGIFDDEVVFKKGDKMYAVSYSFDKDGGVTFDDDSYREVRNTYTTVATTKESTVRETIRTRKLRKAEQRSIEDAYRSDPVGLKIQRDPRTGATQVLIDSKSASSAVRRTPDDRIMPPRKRRRK